MSVLSPPWRRAGTTAAVVPRFPDRPLCSRAAATREGDPMPHCRILLADGHPLLLGVMGRFLAEVPGIQVVARTRTGSRAMSLVALHRPDLLLMNLILPDVSGLELTRRLTAAAWTPRIVLMSLHDEPEYRRAVEAAGADGFVRKQDLGTRLLPLIRSLMDTTQATCPLESGGVPPAVAAG